MNISPPNEYYFLTYIRELIPLIGKKFGFTNFQSSLNWKRRNKMNIRKTLLLTLIIAIASLGLTLTGCEKSDHPTGDHPSTDAVAKCPKCDEAVGSEACCMTKAAEETTEDVKEAVEKAVSEHPTEHPTK
jgi:hypothetical protein